MTDELDAEEGDDGTEDDDVSAEDCDDESLVVRVIVDIETLAEGDEDPDVESVMVIVRVDSEIVPDKEDEVGTEDEDDAEPALVVNSEALEEVAETEFVLGEADSVVVMVIVNVDAETSPVEDERPLLIPETDEDTVVPEAELDEADPVTASVALVAVAGVLLPGVSVRVKVDVLPCWELEPDPELALFVTVSDLVSDAVMVIVEVMSVEEAELLLLGGSDEMVLLVLLATPATEVLLFEVCVADPVMLDALDREEVSINVTVRVLVLAEPEPLAEMVTVEYEIS